MIGEPRIDLESCGSTNDELARRAQAGAAAGTVLVAARQSAGRGRSGNAWHSPPGNLYLSILLRPRLAPAAVPPLALAAGVGACRALISLGVAARLKWPNDVVVGERKIAGILVESASRGGALEHVIVGIGVNVATREFPPELAAIATSVSLELGRTVDREAVLAALVEALEGPIQAFVRGGVAAIAPAWLELARDLGRRARATVHGREVSGRVIGLTASGALELEVEPGRRLAVVAGPVEIE